MIWLALFGGAAVGFAFAAWMTAGRVADLETALGNVESANRAQYESYVEVGKRNAELRAELDRIKEARSEAGKLAWKNRRAKQAS